MPNDDFFAHSIQRKNYVLFYEKLILEKERAGENTTAADEKELAGEEEEGEVAVEYTQSK